MKRKHFTGQPVTHTWPTGSQWKRKLFVGVFQDVDGGNVSKLANTSNTIRPGMPGGPFSPLTKSANSPPSQRNC